MDSWTRTLSFFWRSETKGVCDFYMQDKDCRKNEISYIALLPAALPFYEVKNEMRTPGEGKTVETETARSITRCLTHNLFIERE